MSNPYEKMEKTNKGAWVIHHGQKTAGIVGGTAEFPALDAAGKAATLLSQLASTNDAVVDKNRVEALAKSSGLNPKIELVGILDILKKKRFVDTSSSGDIAVLGVTSRATVGHAADIFEDQDPSSEEMAAILLAETSSNEPVGYKYSHEFVSDSFKLDKVRASEILERSEAIGFVDAEGSGADKLYFNGNIFRRDNIEKVSRILTSLSSGDEEKVREVDSILKVKGCLPLQAIKRVLGDALFHKLRSAGMYDVNHVANPLGEHGFVNLPSAFHKFNDPLVDDAFDLAKALVAALCYGMTQSDPGRGHINMIVALLNKLIAGLEVGPATAIGEDYRVLETKGVIKVTRAKNYGYTMRLLKVDIGEMALRVLTKGETASNNALDRPLPGKMTGYAGPEKTRADFRKTQISASRKMTYDVLQALRTGGGR